MLILFESLFTVSALIAIFSVIRKKKEGRFGAKGMMFWVLFWLLAIIAVLWPDSTTVLANRFGIGRGTDFICIYRQPLFFI